jgi:hypothetical protein
MNRCMNAFLFCLALLAGTVHAEGFVREAPKDVKPGRMVVMLPPQITMDGKADRLSPGARIRDTNNMMVLSGALSGLSVPVVYRRDGTGLVHEVWILTAAEYARLGGDANTAQGYLRFVELLAAIFGARK